MAEDGLSGVQSSVPWLLAIAVFLTGSAHAAEPACAEVSQAASFEHHLISAERAFADLDPDGFVAGLEHASLALPCLSSVLSPEVAAHFHRVAGLNKFTSGMRSEAAAYLSASRAIDPDGTFPPDMLPASHPVLELYEHPGVDATVKRSVPKAAFGDVYFDGKQVRQRPANVPTIFQTTDDTGAVTSTALLTPERALPIYEGVSLRRQASQVTAASSGGLLIVSAVLYASARASEKSFENDSGLMVGELASLRSRTNALAATSYGLGALGFAGMGGAIILGRH